MITIVSYSALTHLECSRCSTRYDAAQVQSTCSCGSPLWVRDDLTPGGRRSPRASSPPGRSTLRRYREVLPVAARRGMVSLGEGMTPVLPSRPRPAIGVQGLA